MNPKSMLFLLCATLLGGCGAVGEPQGDATAELRRNDPAGDDGAALLAALTPERRTALRRSLVALHEEGESCSNCHIVEGTIHKSDSIFNFASYAPAARARILTYLVGTHQARSQDRGECRSCHNSGGGDAR